jgi:hypothetical protein
MSGWESELIKQAMLEGMPDNGTLSRRLRRWNVRQLAHLFFGRQ